MPALRALGRRWYIGSDDLFFPSLFGAGVRFIWCIVLAYVYFSYHLSANHKDCENPKLIEFYLICATILILCIFINKLAIICYSGRGGVMQVEKRRPIPNLLFVRAVLMFVEIALCAFGTYWCFTEKGCSNDISVPIKLIVFSNWLIIGMDVIFIIVVFDPFGGYYNDQSMNDKLWEKRCKWWFCCIPDTGDNYNHNAFNDIATILASQFEDIDLVVSDVAVGLMIVSHQQYYCDIKKYSINGHVFQTRCTPFDFDNNASRKLFQDLEYYSRYAIGAYGWPFYIMMNACTGCFAICQECSLCGETHSETDNACQSNYIALKKLTGLEDGDVIYTGFESDIYCPSFYIAVDHDKNTIIIAIRGTLSLQDVVTDMVCQPDQLPDYPEHYLAHRGMLNSAKNIYNILKQKELLDKTFQCYPDFKLLVVGHSLGAGTAAILSFLLRHEYPNMQCLAFGPPGGLLSSAAVEESRKFVVSTIIDKEFSTRLSIKSLTELRDNVLTAIRTNSRPKWMLTLDHVFKSLRIRQNSGVSRSEEDLLITPEIIAEEVDTEQYPSLYPPGNVVFIHKTNHDRTCCNSSNNSYEVLNAPNDIFDFISVSPDMITDHLPDTLGSLLNKLQPVDSPVETCI